MIMDASAFLALLQDEAGSEQVAESLDQCVISAANLSEIAAKLIQCEVPEKDAVSILKSFDLDVVPVDEEIALVAATLIKKTRQFGLSLGDRICLATALVRSKPALTADKAWANVECKGLDVLIVRRLYP